LIHPSLETDRLLLRPPEDSDIDAWTAMLTDPEVARYLGPPFASRADVAAHIRTMQERHRSDGFGLLAVVRKDDGVVIGRSGFLVWDTRTWSTATLREAGRHAEVEIGWTLARDAWGFGYATEAGAACRDHGFGRLGLSRIAAVIQHGNDRSIAVAHRLGMSHERDIRTAKGFEAQLWAVGRSASRRSRKRRSASEWTSSSARS
jgi:RimJ/RimL family protein N-acetyltransferase